jgi:hypothetical protein
MITLKKTDEFYKNSNLYLAKDELIQVKDNNGVKCIIIPEKLVKKYSYILDDEKLKQQILNSFKEPILNEIEESFCEDMPK